MKRKRPRTQVVMLPTSGESAHSAETSAPVPFREADPDCDVDKFIWNGYCKNQYARFVLMLFRLPAVAALDWEPWIKDFKNKLFCTYEGKRYKCTGASRLGDIYLHPDFEKSIDYSPYAPPGFRGVDARKCTDWSDKP